MISCDQRAVSRAPAAEHGQAEHGSKGSQVALSCANRNEGIIATVMLQKRRKDARALRKLRETSTASPLDFARSALECDASSHRFLRARAAQVEDRPDNLKRDSLGKYAKWPPRHDQRRE